MKEILDNISIAKIPVSTKYTIVKKCVWGQCEGYFWQYRDDKDSSTYIKREHTKMLIEYLEKDLNIDEIFFDSQLYLTYYEWLDNELVIPVNKKITLRQLKKDWQFIRHGNSR